MGEYLATQYEVHKYMGIGYSNWFYLVGVYIAHGLTNNVVGFWNLDDIPKHKGRIAQVIM